MHVDSLIFFKHRSIYIQKCADFNFNKLSESNLLSLIFPEKLFEKKRIFEKIQKMFTNFTSYDQISPTFLTLLQNDLFLTILTSKNRINSNK